MEGSEVTILVLLLLFLFISILAAAAEMGLRQLAREGLQAGAAEGRTSVSSHLGLTVLRQAFGGAVPVPFGDSIVDWPVLFIAHEAGRR